MNKNLKYILRIKYIDQQNVEYQRKASLTQRSKIDVYGIDIKSWDQYEWICLMTRQNMNVKIINEFTNKKSSSPNGKYTYILLI